MRQQCMGDRIGYIIGNIAVESFWDMTRNIRGTINGDKTVDVRDSYGKVLVEESGVCHCRMGLTLTSCVFNSSKIGVRAHLGL